MKVKTLKGSLSLVIAFLFEAVLPLVSSLAAVIILVATDFYTGVRAARKREEKIVSKGLRKTVGKIRDYFLAILLSHMVQQTWMPGVPLTFIVSSYIALTELLSNIENLSQLTGVDIYSHLAGHIKRFISKK